MDRLTEDQRARLLASGYDSGIITRMNKTKSNDNPELVASAVDLLIAIQEASKVEGACPLTESFELSDNEEWQDNGAYQRFETTCRQAHMTFLVDKDNESKMTMGQRTFAASFVCKNLDKANSKAANQINRTVYTDDKFKEVSSALLKKTATELEALAAAE